MPPDTSAELTRTPPPAIIVRQPRRVETPLRGTLMTHPKIERRSFLATAAAAATLTSAALGRDYGKNAGPVRYPDPDIVVLDKRFAKYKIGNSAIQRLHTGTLWAEEIGRA